MAGDYLPRTAIFLRKQFIGARGRWISRPGLEFGVFSRPSFDINSYKGFGLVVIGSHVFVRHWPISA